MRIIIISRTITHTIRGRRIRLRCCSGGHVWTRTVVAVVSSSRLRLVRQAEARCASERESFHRVPFALRVLIVLARIGHMQFVICWCIVIEEQEEDEDLNSRCRYVWMNFITYAGHLKIEIITGWIPLIYFKIYDEYTRIWMHNCIFFVTF